MASIEKILTIDDLSVSYGRIAAVRHVNMEIRNGEIVALLGANGAGKSTILRAILRIQRSQNGKIVFMGKDISHKSTETIIASGITYLPEGGGILPNMTVRENMLLGAIFSKEDTNKNLHKVYERFQILEERQYKMAGTLSGGQRQILAIGRALMSSPKLLMMDEPSLGLAPIMITKVFEIVKELAQTAYTIILSEQNARKALQYANRAYVLQVGDIVIQGSSTELLNNPEIRKAYFGGNLYFRE